MRVVDDSKLMKKRIRKNVYPQWSEMMLQDIPINRWIIIILLKQAAVGIM